MRYADIGDGVVKNIAESNRPLNVNWVALAEGATVSIGDTYKNGVYYDPKGAARLMPDTALVAGMLEAMMEGVANA